MIKTFDFTARFWLLSDTASEPRQRRRYCITERHRVLEKLAKKKKSNIDLGKRSKRRLNPTWQIILGRGKTIRDELHVK